MPSRPPIQSELKPGEKLSLYNQGLAPARYTLRFEDGTKVSMVLAVNQSCEVIVGTTHFDAIIEDFEEGPEPFTVVD